MDTCVILSFNLYQYILHTLAYVQNTFETFKNVYHKIKKEWKIENWSYYGLLMMGSKKRG